MTWGRTTAAIAVLVGAVTLTGCSEAPANVPVSSPEPTVSVTAASAPAGSGSGTPVTDKPIATQTAVKFAEPSVTVDPAKLAKRNEAGGLWVLDDAGARACSFTEFAFRAPETGADAAKNLASMRKVVVGSKNSTLVAAVEALGDKPSTDDLAGVLKICASMGYQL